MKAPEMPINEKERLKTLLSYSILDTLPEVDYDNITAIASQICGTPISLVTLVDSDRQWFKSNYGLKVTETPRNYAFCGHAINTPDDAFIINDARKDNRFFDNPLVTNDPNVIFYAGIPIIGTGGLPLGTLCVIDNKPRDLSEIQIKTLKALSYQVMNLLELRRTKFFLEKSLEELKELNIELESFAHIAAHDLKSPLNNISGIADLFLSEYEAQIDSEGLEFIKIILNSSDKLRNMIDGLLQYSKSSKILSQNNSLIIVETFFNEIKNLFSLETNGSINLKTDVASISTNKTALEQVFLNLISNAIKYNDKSESIIEITIHEDEEYYLFTIEDNGPGIEKDNFEKIFKVFETVSHQDKFGDKGNGIGLALVKKIIDGLNGKISLTSQIGQGTKFSFSIAKL